MLRVGLISVAMGVISSLLACRDEQAGQEAEADAFCAFDAANCRRIMDPDLGQPDARIFDAAAPDAWPDIQAPDLGVDAEIQNLPPILESVGDKEVDEGDVLSFTLQARDPEEDILRFIGNQLPEGAALDAETGDFLWSPTHDQEGVYAVTFILTDGRHFVSERITITVHNVIADQDGDGWMDDADCNDHDPHVLPLEEFVETSFSEDAVICPGLYRGVNIVFDDDDVILIGKDVFLDHFNAALSETAIEISDRHSIVVDGFHIRNYEHGAYLLRGRNTALAIDEIDPGERYPRIHGVVLEDSNANFVAVTDSGQSNVVLHRSSSNIIADSHFHLSGIWLDTSFSTTIRNNNFVSSAGNNAFDVDATIYINGWDNIVRNNHLDRVGGGPLGVGAITVWHGVHNTLIENNVLEEGRGVGIGDFGGETVIVNNAITGRASSGNGAVFIAANNSHIEDNTITDNSRGLLMGGHGHTVRNNDLRRNRDGNQLRCEGDEGNVCDGNLE
jgi:parallel beta-helix repeat protein